MYVLRSVGKNQEPLHFLLISVRTLPIPWHGLNLSPVVMKISTHLYHLTQIQEHYKGVSIHMFMQMG